MGTLQCYRVLYIHTMDILLTIRNFLRVNNFTLRFIFCTSRLGNYRLARLSSQTLCNAGSCGGYCWFISLIRLVLVLKSVLPQSVLKIVFKNNIFLLVLVLLRICITPQYFKLGIRQKKLRFSNILLHIEKHGMICNLVCDIHKCS